MGLRSLLSRLAGGEKVDYRTLIDNGAIIVDVRTPQEFRSGHAKGSKNIPLQSLNKSIAKLKNKEVVLVCRSGGRARSAKAVLNQHGITAHNAGAWQNLRGI